MKESRKLPLRVVYEHPTSHSFMLNNKCDFWIQCTQQDKKFLHWSKKSE